MTSRRCNVTILRAGVSMNRANSCSLLSSQDMISPYNIDRISNRLVMRTENYRVGHIQCQILWAYIIGIMWQTEGRITMKWKVYITEFWLKLCRYSQWVLHCLGILCCHDSVSGLPLHKSKRALNTTLQVRRTRNSVNGSGDPFSSLDPPLIYLRS